MCYVEVRDDGQRKNCDWLDIALKELKRKMKKENIFQDLKRKEFHMAPSEKKRFKGQEAYKRRKREEKKSEWFKSK